jgi:HD-GYP domain-containing protein (c-di-GMP phosphodiesterase class II)
VTGDRPYRRALVHAEALAELQRCAGTQFDPRVVEAFVRVFAGGAPAEPLLEPLEGDDPAESATAAAV